MLLVPKTVAPLYTLQNDLVRFDIGIGADFNWAGISSLERKDIVGPQGGGRLALNIRHLWEVVCVRPTRNVETEHFKTVSSGAVTPAYELISGAPYEDGANVVRLTWDDVLVDGDTSDSDLDRLKVVVEIELRADEAFARMRIDARWTTNNRVDGEAPGRYAIWRVRFPIVDVSPAHALNVSDDPEWMDSESGDVLFVPENYGRAFLAPETSVAGDPALGMQSPQDRAAVLRNVVRPGSAWRQSYPGRASTQAMGYYGTQSGRGVLVGCLDRFGYLKEFLAAGEDNSVRMEVVHVPEWCYSIGNRPNGFTGSVDGDSLDAFASVHQHAPQAESSLPAQVGEVPDTRSIDAGAQVSPNQRTAALGMSGLGMEWLGFDGVNTNRSLALGYVSPFDVALAPVQVFGGDGWQKMAEEWRSIAEFPDSAFPRRKKLNASAQHPAATAQYVLDIDAAVHEGQESLFGLDTEDLPAAYAARNGVTIDIDELITPKVAVEDRVISSDTEIAGEGSILETGDVLGPTGAKASLANYGTTRGAIQLFGVEGFWIDPVQVARGSLVTSYYTGDLRFRSFNAKTAGVKPGDIVVITSSYPVESRYGRVASTVASDSEGCAVAPNDRLRIVMEVNNDGSLVVGKYINDRLERRGFAPRANNPGRCFEVQIMRRELHVRTYEVESLGSGVYRTLVGMADDELSAFIRGATWAERVEASDSAAKFRKIYSQISDSVIRVYLEFSAEDPQPAGWEASSFANTTVRIKRRVEPLCFDPSVAASWIAFGGSERNRKARKLSWPAGVDPTADLSIGILRFEEPVTEETGEFTYSIYSTESSASRVLGPADDFVWEGRRFIDEGYASSVAGGFRKSVQPGDVLYLINPTEADNEAGFGVTEVLSESQILVDRPFVAEPAGLSYRIVHRSRVLRDLHSLRLPQRDPVSGPRRVVEGLDRIHALAIGWMAQPGESITGVYGVDSTSKAELGSNPFVPATSINLTTYRRSPVGTLDPSREFVVSKVLSASEIQFEGGWDVEDPTFTVTFSDVGAVTLRKNVLQYRIVRRQAADLSVIKSAISEWGGALETTALFALVRGWRSDIRGFRQPDMAMPAEMVTAVGQANAPVAATIDPLDLDATAQSYTDERLQAIAYYNRFGERSMPAVPGDAAAGEEDRLADPSVPRWSEAMLSLVLEPLAQASGLLLTGFERALRDSYGSPCFISDTEYQVAVNGGGFRRAEVLQSIFDNLGVHVSAEHPADWLLGQAGLFTGDWTGLDREEPKADILFPIQGAYTQSLLECTVTNDTFFCLGLSMEAQRATLYGFERRIEPGDELEILPSGERAEIVSVGDGLGLDMAVSLSGQTDWRVHLRRDFAKELSFGVPFFSYAFGEYATVAADVTFLANDVSWAEVIARRPEISEAAYASAVEQVYARAMWKTAVNCLAGVLPQIRTEAGAPLRVPTEIASLVLRGPGTTTLAEQRQQLFGIAGGQKRLIAEHLAFMHVITVGLQGLEGWTRFGAPEFGPDVTGATSLQIEARPLSVVQASSFVNVDGERLLLAADWAPVHIGGKALESVTLGWDYAERGVTTGYWTAVSLEAAGPTWLGFIDDVPELVDTSREFAVTLSPLGLKRIIVYEQRVLVRYDASSVEVDRVLVVPKWHSVRAAFDVIALDVAKGGSGVYKVVVGTGAIEDSLEIPAIVGATMEIQRSADEYPEIEEVP